MGADRYINEVEVLLCEIAKEVCAFEGLDEQYVMYYEHDTRKTLFRLKERLFKKAEQEKEDRDIDRLRNSAKCIGWLRTVFIIKHHYKIADPLFVATALASTLELFLVFNYEKLESVERLTKNNDALFSHILAEFYGNVDEKEQDDNVPSQIQQLNDKIDRLVKSEANGQLPGPQNCENNLLQQRLKLIRDEIERVAAERGKKIREEQHLLQTSALDDLIRIQPENIKLLHRWASGSTPTLGTLVSALR